MASRKRSTTELVGRKMSDVINSTLSQVLLSQNGLESTISLLSFHLYVARINKEDLSHSTHYLLQILLRLLGEGPQCRRKHFFSFTETPAELSVIMDKELLDILVPDGRNSKVEVTDCKWRPLVVEVGALGSLTGISNIVATVITPLADWGVSVFCLSTNLDDFVMVKESDLDRALTCLSRRFKVVCDTDNELDLALVKNAMQKYTTVHSPLQKHSATVVYPNPPCSEGGSRPLVHPYSCSASQYVVCGVIPQALPAIGTILLDLLLFNHRSSSSENFLSFSVIEEDISLVMDLEDIDRFPETSLYLNKDTWRLIRIGSGPLGFDECGIVAQVASPLAQADIYSYYICTFSTDHTLVPEGSVQKTLKLLNDRYLCKLIKDRNGGVLSGHIQPLSDSSQCLNGGVLSGHIQPLSDSS